MITLNAVKAGMTRLRDKGGANPESLYELQNAYVTAARTIKSRPGTVLAHELPDATRGLCVFKGELWTFCHQSADMSGAGGVRLAIVRHPSNPILTIKDIHFAAPFMGYLYVVPEYENGDVFHFWLTAYGTWEPNTVMLEGQTVEPTVPNGYVYEATRTDTPHPVWAPGVVRAVDDKVEPTQSNGYRYVCVETFGDNPASGTAEPTWPTPAGAQVRESSELEPPPPPSTSTPPDTSIPPDVSDRYGAFIGSQVRFLTR